MVNRESEEEEEVGSWLLVCEVPRDGLGVSSADAKFVAFAAGGGCGGLLD